VGGCSKVSPGCKDCYAINHVHRMAGNPNPKIKVANEGLTVVNGAGMNWTGEVRLIPERLEIPLRRKVPTTYFVNSLSDLFHEKLTDEAIDQILAVMALCPQHRFQVLTKRAERMGAYFAGEWISSRVDAFAW
jgi:protein gp37